MALRDDSGKKTGAGDIGKTCAAILFATLCQAPCALNPTIRFDSDLMMTNGAGILQEWESLGRFGLVAVKRLLGLTTYQPVKSGVLFLLFFALSLLILSAFLQRFYGGDHAFPGLFSFILLCGSCPVWAFQSYFNLQIAEIGLMLAACSLAAGVSVEAACTEKAGMKTVLYVLSGILLFACLTTYQAFAVYYTAVAAMLFIVRMSGPAADLNARKAALMMLHFVLVILVYLMISRRSLPSDGYLMQQMLWGKVSVVTCLFNVLVEAGKICLLYSSGQFSFFPAGMILLAAAVLFRTKGAKRGLLWYGSCVLFLTTPLWMSVLFGNRTVPRMQFALPVASAFLPSLTLMLLRDSEHPAGFRIRRILQCACVGFVVLQAVLGLRLAYTDRLRFQQDQAYAARLTEALAPYADTQKPVLFLGAHHFTDDSVRMEKTDVYGNSFFEWTYDEALPDSCDAGARRYMRLYTGQTDVFADGQLTGEMREEALRLLKEAGDEHPADVRVLEGGTVIAVVMR